ncbi:MAG: class I SAM-dependent methyltransferase [Myxococcaceae bacterium]|jgi:SAM-dependent methyltransferase|nr:class I SAM-dependent methyltransferase [Myxococcaceae bacterium]
MADPRDFWNARYAMAGFAYGTEPNDLLREAAPRLQGPVLSLGEGEGRNAVFLAGLGLDVTAVDLSAAGLEKARALAAGRGVALTTLEADLADFDLGEARWGAIVSIWCHLPPWARQRVHAGVIRALRPGGRFVLEAYTPRQLAFDTGGPKNEALLYEPDAVRAELAGLTLERCDELQREVLEGDWHRGRSAVLQVLARR